MRWKSMRKAEMSSTCNSLELATYAISTPFFSYELGFSQDEDHSKSSQIECWRTFALRKFIWSLIVWRLSHAVWIFEPMTHTTVRVLLKGFPI